MLICDLLFDYLIIPFEIRRKIDPIAISLKKFVILHAKTLSIFTHTEKRKYISNHYNLI